MAGNLVAFDIGQYQAKLVWYAGKTEKKAVAAPLPDGLAENGEIRSRRRPWCCRGGWCLRASWMCRP